MNSPKHMTPEQALSVLKDDDAMPIDVLNAVKALEQVSNRTNEMNTVLVDIRGQAESALKRSASYNPMSPIYNGIVLRINALQLPA